MGEPSTILFINLLKIVSLLCERLILKLFSFLFSSYLDIFYDHICDSNIHLQIAKLTN